MRFAASAFAVFVFVAASNPGYGSGTVSRDRQLARLAYGMPRGEVVLGREGVIAPSVARPSGGTAASRATASSRPSCGARSTIAWSGMDVPDRWAPGSHDGLGVQAFSMTEIW